MTYLAVCLRDVVISVIVKTCVCFNLEFSYDFEDSLQKKEKATVQSSYRVSVWLHVVLVLVCLALAFHMTGGD